MTPPPFLNREVLLLLSVSSAATYAVYRASGPGHHHVVRIVHHLSRLSSIFPEEFHSRAWELTSAPSVFIFRVVWGAGPDLRLHKDVEFSGTMGGSIWPWHLSKATPSLLRGFLSVLSILSGWSVCLFSCPQPLTWLLSLAVFQGQECEASCIFVPQDCFGSLGVFWYSVWILFSSYILLLKKETYRSFEILHWFYFIF